jgi:sulfate permease, SulP family
VLAFLIWSRKGLGPALQRYGVKPDLAKLLSKTALLVAVVVSTLLVWVFGLNAHGVSIVGEIPRGLPALSMPALDLDMIGLLLAPAVMIAIVGYVESISIAQTLAAKKRQAVDANSELIALGLANIGAGVTQAMPVTGGLSRSIVNFDAGAATPAAGALTAVGIALALLLLTPLMFICPMPLWRRSSSWRCCRCWISAPCPALGPIRAPMGPRWLRRLPQPCWWA